MTLPKINLMDGRHKLIVAEDGERVLTPQQNKEYEGTHPNARKHPMLAKIGGETAGLFDATADVSAAPEIGMGAPRQLDTVPGDTTARAPSAPKAKRPMGKINFDVQPNENTKSVTSPLLNQEAFDKGGTVQPSITDRIKSRAVDLYNQGKALLAPMDNEAEALKKKQQNIDEATQMKPFVAAPTSTPAAKPNPAGAYGTRPGEKRPEDLFRPQAGTPLGKAYDCGGRIEVYDKSGEVKTSSTDTPDIYMTHVEHPENAENAEKIKEQEQLNQLQQEQKVRRERLTNVASASPLGLAYDCGGRIEVYDESGVVSTDEEHDDPAKEAAYHQAAAEVHAEEAEKHKANDNAIMNNMPLTRSAQDAPQAPAGFGGHMIPNPKGITPKLDTDLPDKEPGSVDTNTDNAPSKTPMNMDNAKPLSPVVTEASVKKPATIEGVPQSTQMRTLQGATLPAEEQGTGELEKRPPEDDKMAIIAKDKEDAAKEGFAGLSKLGLAMIHENAFKPEYLNRPAEAAPTIPTDMPGKAKELPLPQPTVETGKQQHADLVAKRKDYDRRIQAAMDLGTPEGDREAESLQLAKQHFDRMNPYGSAANHPGLLGKIEHGLAKAGNIAGNIVAPGTMALIPGTELNKQHQAAQLRGQEQEATKESLEQAQARMAGQKTPAEATFRELQTTINPDTLPGRPLYDPKNPQGRFFTKPEALDRVQTPGKSESVTWARAAVQAGDYDNLEHALTAYDAQKAGMPHMTDKERHLQDYIKSTGGNPNDPLTRDRATVAMAKRDVETKANAALPIQERLKAFQQGLDIEKQQLSSSQNKALEYGKAAKDQEMKAQIVRADDKKSTDTALQALDSGSSFGAAITPIMALLGATRAEQVKRVNKQELDRFMPGAIGFKNWAEAHADAFVNGDIPDQYRADVRSFIVGLDKSSQTDLEDKLKAIDKVYGGVAEAPVPAKGGGVEKKPQPIKPTTAPPTTPTAGGGGMASWKAANNKPVLTQTQK